MEKKKEKFKRINYKALSNKTVTQQCTNSIFQIVAFLQTNTTS